MERLVHGWPTGVLGLSMLVLAPAKLRGSVRGGLPPAAVDPLAVGAFGVLVLATIALGVLHATGLWYGVGYWSALWTHSLFAFLLDPAVPVAPRDPARAAAAHRPGSAAVLRGGARRRCGRSVRRASRVAVTAGGLAGGTAGPPGRTRSPRTTRPACRAGDGSTTTPRRASTEGLAARDRRRAA